MLVRATFALTAALAGAPILMAQPAEAPSAARPAAARPAPGAKPAAVGRPRTVKDLRFPKLKELKLPEITEFTLANGMRVFLLENHELPLVRGYAMVRAGNIYDPADKVGLADVFSDVMRTGGTKSKTGDELNELLEGIAASVETNIGETSGTVSFNMLTEHTDTVLEIFKDLLTAPEFRQDKLDVALTQMRSAILRRNDQASSIAPREFSRLIYGPDTPWGRQVEIEHVDRITRADLLAYHQRFFFPANILLSVQGDFDTAAMRAKLEKLFADWNVKQPPVPAPPPVTAKPKPGVYLAEKSDVNQTTFRLGHLGGMLKDKDYPALEVMADILGGGGFANRLMQKVRSDLGLAYNVGAEWNANYNHPGTFVIAGGTKSESTVEALRTILGEVERIRTAEVSDDELRLAKESTLNSFVFNFDTPGKTLNRLVGYEYHGYPRDFIFQYQKAVAAVTKADVLRVAKQYLKPEEFVIVAVGNPAEMKTPLSALNLPVNKIDLTIPQPKAAASKMDDASLARGKQLLAALQAAVGGAEKLAAVKDYSHTAEVTVAQMQGVKIKQIASILGDAIRFEQQLPFGKLLIYSDGKGGGWMSGPQGLAPLPPQFSAQTKGELFRLHPRLFLSDRNPDRTVNAVGDREIEISDKAGDQIRLTLDASNLVTKASYRSPDGQAIEQTYEDWKDAGQGLRFPHRYRITLGGKPAAEIVIEGYKLNSGLTAEALAAKP